MSKKILQVDNLKQKKIDHFIKSGLKEKIAKLSLDDKLTINNFIKIGKKALDVIIGGTYQTPIHMFREYVSNAVDSKSESQVINIHFEENAANISFYDEGEGMDENTLLLGLIMFEGIKTHDDEDIGELGIGLYAGGKICNRIQILTKKKDMKYFVKAELPIKEWRESSQRDEFNEEESEVAAITNFDLSKVSVTPREYNAHYTNIQLIDLRKDILEKIQSGEFIREFSNILPIEFPEDFPQSDQVKNYLKGWITKKIKVFYNGKQLYRTVPLINLENFQPQDIYLEINGKKDIVAKMWIATNPDLHRLGGQRAGYEPDTGLLEGVAIRHKNVEIIPRRVVNGWLRRYNQRFLSFFGDCQIVKPRTKYFQNLINIIPQTNRTDFQYDAGWEKVKEAITIKLEEVCKGVRDAQGSRSKQRKNKKQIISDKADNTLDEAFNCYDSSDYKKAAELFDKAKNLYEKHNKDFKSQIKICSKFKNKALIASSKVVPIDKKEEDKSSKLENIGEDIEERKDELEKELIVKIDKEKKQDVKKVETKAILEKKSVAKKEEIKKRDEKKVEKKTKLEKEQIVRRDKGEKLNIKDVETEAELKKKLVVKMEAEENRHEERVEEKEKFEKKPVVNKEEEEKHNEKKVELRTESGKIEDISVISKEKISDLYQIEVNIQEFKQQIEEIYGKAHILSDERYYKSIGQEVSLKDLIATLEIIIHILSDSDEL